MLDKFTRPPTKPYQMTSMAIDSLDNIWPRQREN